MGWLTLCVGQPARFHLPIRPGDDKGGGAPAEDPKVRAAVAPYLAAADAERQRLVGVRLELARSPGGATGSRRWGPPPRRRPGRRWARRSGS